VSGTERKLIEMFKALAMNDEEAVMPARRYLSKPRLALDSVRTAFSFRRVRLFLSNGDTFDLAFKN
jgi:hypothetical protein